MPCSTSECDCRSAYGSARTSCTRSARLLYPQLEGVEYEYRWAGRIAIKPIPLHALQRGYINAGVAWYGLLDALS
ncbi:hypothetical protein [Paraburkholderia flava]|uniref:hypothetical protein n=1 Tax=Paraburkholderia flava TaxID=2547393 RepID=UPI00105EF6A2|nr:hypothetical protein [Paraburkholderia flava]